MGKNLFDFGDEKIEEEKKQKQAGDNMKEKIEGQYDKYKGYSKSELEIEIEKEIKRQKASGTFNYSKLMKNIEMMKPYITPQQYENMMAMLERFR